MTPANLNQNSKVLVSGVSKCWKALAPNGRMFYNGTILVTKVVHTPRLFYFFIFIFFRLAVRL